MSSAKQYRARYGLKPRKKVDAIFKARMAATQCPYCLKHSVKRIAAGIWQCSSCSTKFSGGAYTFRPKDYQTKVVEAEFLKSKEGKGKRPTGVEGFDAEQEVSF
jgi:large subunit ribosomal protein L37Ae